MPKGYYKISPRIREFIVQKSQEADGYSCRKFTSVLWDEFRVRISKSSINSIIRKEGLSKPAGRRPKAEYNNHDAAVESALKALSFKQPFQDAGGKNPLPGGLQNKTGYIENRVLAVKLILNDNSEFFIDGCFNTIWPSDIIPKDFSLELSILRGRLNDFLFVDNQPLILLVAAGSEAAPKAFTDFLASFTALEESKMFNRVELYKADGGLTGIVEDVPKKKINFIFGLWPWQFKDRGILDNMRAVKLSPAGGIDFCLITNLKETQADNDRVIELYLSRWPDFVNSYQDLLRKIIGREAFS